MEIQGNSKAWNTIRFRGHLKDSNGAPIIITAPADTLLNDIDGVGLGVANVFKYGVTPLSYAETTDDDSVYYPIHNVNCFTESENGSIFYFRAPGGIAAGQYNAVMIYKVKDSGTLEEQLSTQTMLFTIDEQLIDPRTV